MTPADLKRALSIPSFFTMPDLEHPSHNVPLISQIARAALVLYHTDRESPSLTQRRIDLEGVRAKCLARLADGREESLSFFDKLVLFSAQAIEGSSNPEALREAFGRLDSEIRKLIMQKMVSNSEWTNFTLSQGIGLFLIKLQDPKGTTFIEELLECAYQNQELEGTLLELERVKKLVQEKPQGWEEEARRNPRWRLLEEYAKSASSDPLDPSLIDKLTSEVSSLKVAPSEKWSLRETRKTPEPCHSLYEVITAANRILIHRMVEDKVFLPELLNRLITTDSKERLYAIEAWLRLERVPLEEKCRVLIEVVRSVDNETFEGLSERIIPSLSSLTPTQELELRLAILNAAINGNSRITEVASFVEKTYQVILSGRFSNEEAFDALAQMITTVAPRFTSDEKYFKALFSIERIPWQAKFKAMETLAKISEISDIQWMLRFGFLQSNELSEEQKFDAQAFLLVLAAENPRVFSFDKFDSLINGSEGAVPLIGSSIDPRKRFKLFVTLAKRVAFKGFTSGCIDLLKSAETIEGISPQEKLSALITTAKLLLSKDSSTSCSWFLDRLGVYERDARKVREATLEILKFVLAKSPATVGYLFDPRTRDKKELDNLSQLGILAQDEPLTYLSPWMSELSWVDISELAPPDSSVGKRLQAETSLTGEPLSPPWRKKLLHRAMALYLRGQDVDLLLNKIMEYRSPSKGAYMVYVLSNIIPSLTLYKELAGDLSFTGPHSSLHYPLLFLVDIAREGKLEAPTEQLKRIVKNIKASFRTTLKDTTKMGMLLNILQSLHQNLELTPEEKLSLLDKLFSGRSKKELLNQASLFSALFAAGAFTWGWPPALPREYTQEDLTRLLASNLNLLEFNLDKYAALTSSQKRLPFGLETFLSRLSSLKDSALTPCIQKFFSSLLNETFKEARYRAEGNLHIEKLQREYPAVWEKWVKLSGSCFSPAVEREGFSSGGGPTAFAYMKQKLIADGHLSHLATRYPHLYHHLAPETDLDLSSPMMPFEEAAIALSNAETEEEEKEKLAALNELILRDDDLKHSEWARDVQDRTRELFASHPNQESRFIFTDDWQDLLLSGTEVLGSCQRLDGNPSLNKCLLSYCMDGKIQMIAAIDPKTHRLQARALLKLLFAEVSPGVMRPALFLERIYPFTPPQEMLAGLNQMAKEAAKELGVPLYTLNPEVEVADETVVLHSLGSSAPYEYSDAGRGVTTGAFSHAGKPAINGLLPFFL